MSHQFPERLLAMQPLWDAWQLESTIGEGSYGKVFKISRQEFGNKYVAALKWMYLPQQASDIDHMRTEGYSDEQIRSYYEDIVYSLNNEIKLMNQLGGNSHIVNYIDHSIRERKGEFGWDILIRMELLTPLNEYLNQNSFSEQEVARLGLHVCYALSLCAGHKIIHRDVKPENIFISDDGNYKLGDFGVSRTMEGTHGDYISRKGTPLYMAPEIFSNKPSSFSADVYSLGLVMYRLLNMQRMPFLPLQGLPTHNDREKAFSRRMQGEVLPFPANGCKALQRIVLKACAYKPEDRYTTAEEMGNQLETLLKTGKLSPENISPGYQQGERSSLHPNLPPPKPLTDDKEHTSTLFGGREIDSQAIPEEPLTPSPPPDSDPSEGAKKPKFQMFAILIAVILVLLIAGTGVYLHYTLSKKQPAASVAQQTTQAAAQNKSIAGDWVAEIPGSIQFGLSIKESGQVILRAVTNTKTEQVQGDYVFNGKAIRFFFEEGDTIGTYAEKEKSISVRLKDGFDVTFVRG